MNNKNAVISIIVPIYNSALYLRECLESIRKQTYESIKVLLIYTKSEDLSENICKEYCEKDDRFKIIYNLQNIKGAGSARNLGLEDVQSDYVGFVDSDDIIHKDMFRVLLENVINNNADISICKEARSINDLGEKSNCEIFDADCGIEELIKGKKYYGELWNKLYSWKLVEDIRFDEGLSVAEDIKYVFQSIIRSNRIVYTDSKLYYYRYNENSITNTYKKVYYYNTMETYKYICDNIQNDNLKNLMKCRMWIYYSQTYLNVSLSDERDKEFLKIVRKNITSLKKNYYTLFLFNKKEIFLTILISNFYNMGVNSYKLIKKVVKRR